MTKVYTAMTSGQGENLYVLIHTMTITERDYVLQAQFFHAYGRTIGRRVSLRVHRRAVDIDRNKANLGRLSAPNLRTLMKRNTGNVRHHLRTVKICPQNAYQGQPSDDKTLVSLASPTSSLPSSEKQQCDEQTNYPNDNLASTGNPLQTTAWLTANRFDKYVQTFSSFSGADMLRMSRDDLIQICGHADGIRLYNALHSKSISPKLTLYICRESSSVFNAVFLNTLSRCELVQKLASLLNISHEQVRDIYVQGPQSIHVQLSNEVIKHIKDETMFQVDVLQENGMCVFLLKNFTK